MITLTIKGRIHAASKAAHERNIVLQAAELSSHGTETTAKCDELYRDAVLRWFAENAELIMGIGYPAGTLLFYN
jgi:hypothetical protein